WLKRERSITNGRSCRQLSIAALAPRLRLLLTARASRLLPWLQKTSPQRTARTHRRVRCCRSRQAPQFRPNENLSLGRVPQFGDVQRSGVYFGGGAGHRTRLAFS